MRTAFRSFLLIFLCPGVDSPNILLKPCCKELLRQKLSLVRLERALCHHLTPLNKHIETVPINCQWLLFFFTGAEVLQVAMLLGFYIYVC